MVVACTQPPAVTAVADIVIGVLFGLGMIDEGMVVKFRKGVKLCNIIKDRIIQKHFQESKLIIDFLLYNILCHDVICDIKKN